MQKTPSSGQSRRYQAGSGVVLAQLTTSRPIFKPRNVVLTIAILWSSFLQLSLSNVQPKKPILIDSIFSQPDKLQLRFRPMGHYAASTFTSHVRIPFDYSALLKLQAQMIERMDRCIPDLDRFHFKIEERDLKVLNSTFELYKSDLNQVFKLFRDLLASLPHVPERERRQWDVASFAIATSSLALSTYNTVQISKLESAIETQKQKTDLMADILQIHEQHLHQLDRMIEDIGNEIAKLKIQTGYYFSIDRAIAQVISDNNKSTLLSIRNWLQVRSVWTCWTRSFTTSRIQLPKTNSTILFTNLQTFINWKLPSFTDLRNRPSFSFFTFLLSKLKTSFLSTNLSHFQSISTSLQTSQSCRTWASRTSSRLATLKLSRLSLHQIWQTANAWAKHFSARVAPSSKQTSSKTASVLSTWAALLSSRTTVNSKSPPPERKFTASETTPGWCTPLAQSPRTKFVPKQTRCLHSQLNQANKSKSLRDATFPPWIT